MRWERVRQQVGLDEAFSGPGKRWGHTCNAVQGGRYLYVFGGYGKNNRQTNEVHVFDTAEQTWSQPSMNGTPPPPRDSHTCTTVGDNLFVFGGTDGMNPYKDLHILETSSNTWICPSVRGEGPEAREGHSSAVVGKRLFIFGGCGRSPFTNGEIYYNDLYILNTETFVWKRAVTSGNPPSPRDSHTCSSWKNKIIVVGGEDEHDYYLSDVHILDTDTLIWKELDTFGQLLSPRAGHCTVAFGRNLFVFGGFSDAQNLYDDLYVLDVETGVWSKVLSSGEGPTARFSANGDCLDPYKGGVLVFMGGCNKNLEALDDMYYFYTGLSSDVWDERDVGRLSLKKQLKLKCQEQNPAIPVYDRALVPINVNSGRENFGLVQPQLYQGKKTFQASLIENLQVGYTIETIIDGKRLRGVVFTNKPGFVTTPTHQSLSRKRPAGSFGVNLNGNDESKPKALKISRQSSMGSQHADDVNITKGSSSHGREAIANCTSDEAEAAASRSKSLNINVPESHETAAAANPSNVLDINAPESHEIETAANPSDISNINAPESHETKTAAGTSATIQLHSDVSQTAKPTITEPSSALLNLNDEQRNEEDESSRNEVSKAFGTVITEHGRISSPKHDETVATEQREADPARFARQ